MQRQQAGLLEGKLGQYLCTCASLCGDSAPSSWRRQASTSGDRPVHAQEQQSRLPEVMMVAEKEEEVAGGQGEEGRGIN